MAATRTESGGGAPWAGNAVLKRRRRKDVVVHKPAAPKAKGTKLISYKKKPKMTTRRFVN
jgi:hypothetical protein